MRLQKLLLFPAGLFRKTGYYPCTSQAGFLRVHSNGCCVKMPLQLFLSRIPERLNLLFYLMPLAPVLRCRNRFVCAKIRPFWAVSFLLCSAQAVWQPGINWQKSLFSNRDQNSLARTWGTRWQNCILPLTVQHWTSC